jgi:hypothetical protein
VYFTLKDNSEIARQRLIDDHAWMSKDTLKVGKRVPVPDYANLLPKSSSIKS